MITRQVVKRARVLDNDAGVANLKAGDERDQLNLVLARSDYRSTEDPNSNARAKPENKTTMECSFYAVPREDADDIEEIEREILNMEYVEPYAEDMEYQISYSNILENRQIISNQQQMYQRPSNEGLTGGVGVYDRVDGQ